MVAVLRNTREAIDEYLRQELSDSANCLVTLSNRAAGRDCPLPLAADGFYNSDEARLLDAPERERLQLLRARLAQSPDGSELKKLSDELLAAADPAVVLRQFAS